MNALPAPGALLAHGPTMVLLDTVMALDDEAAVCGLRVAARSPFFEPGRGVPGWVGVEYMAQTIGVHAGHLRHRDGRPVQIGLLLGTRAYECDRAWFSLDSELTVEVALLVRDSEGVAAYDCRILAAGTVCARAQIKAFQPEDTDAFLDRIYGDHA